MANHSTLYRKAAWNAQQKAKHGKPLLLPPLHYALLTFLIIIWLIAVAVYLINARYTEKTSVQGYISQTHSVATISAPEAGGVISQVWIQEGEWVEKGDALVSVQRGKSVLHGEAESAQRKRDLHAKRILNQRTHKLAVSEVQQGIASAQKHITTLRKQQQIQFSLKQQVRQQLQQAQVRLTQLQSMLTSQLVSKLEVENKEFAIFQLQQQFDNLGTQQLDLNMQLDIAKQQLANFGIQQQQLLTKAEQQQQQFEQDLRALQFDSQYTLFASISGTVSALQVEVGSDLHRHNSLLKITPPNNELRVTLMIPSQSAGFVSTNQTVMLRLDAFPYQQFGMLSARISDIDFTLLMPNEIKHLPIGTQQPVFLASAVLSDMPLKAYGQTITLRSGLTLQADIQLWDRSLLEWLLAPIYALKGTV